MSSHQSLSVSRAQAQARLVHLRRTAPVGARELGEDVSSAVEMARAAHDKLLEAEAFALYARWLLPTNYPRRTLEVLFEAESIFVAHRMPDRALAARVGAAHALLELGEEQNAISNAELVLGCPDSLRVEDQAAAVYVAALSHGRLGAVDAGLQMLDDFAPQLTRARARSAMLGSRLDWARALLLFKAFLFSNQPSLWRGPPASSGMVRMSISAPSAGELLRMLDSGSPSWEASNPSWPYAEMMAHGLRGLEGGLVRADEAIRHLHALSEKLEEYDPPSSGWALMYCAMVQLHHAQGSAALDSLQHAMVLAETFQLDGLRRDLLTYMAHAWEEIGDWAKALAATKQLKVQRLRSVVATPPPALAYTPQVDALSTANAQGAGKARRNLEPAHVRRALRFIEVHIRERLPVQALVDHCQVSRRTLEIAFRESRGTTLAEYIRDSKLELAAFTLLRTDHPIQRVARELGFSSAAAFSKEFSAYYGVPPSVWMKEHRRDFSNPT